MDTRDRRSYTTDGFSVFADSCTGPRTQINQFQRAIYSTLNTPSSCSREAMSSLRYTFERCISIGLRRHEQRLGDLAVAVTLGRVTGDAQLAGRERVASADALAAGPCPARRELHAGPLDQPHRAAGDRDVKPGGQRFTGRRRVAPSAVARRPARSGRGRARGAPVEPSSTFTACSRSSLPAAPPSS